MPYTLDQAEKDKIKFERMAAEADKQGDKVMAGLYRVEASNCLERVGMKKAHKPNLGPYSDNNPPYCVDCKKPKD